MKATLNSPTPTFLESLIALFALLSSAAAGTAFGAGMMYWAITRNWLT
jgi:hypothetical protein